MPVVTPITGGLTVRWDGLFTDALNAPMDFARVEVHVSAVSDFVPDSAATLQSTIESPRGGTVVVRLPVGLYYVACVTRSLSGGASPGSVQGSGTSLAAASGVDLSDAVTAAEAYADARLIDAEAYADARLIDAEAYADAAVAVLSLPVYADNAAAITGGRAVGAMYRNGADPDYVCIVH